MVKLIKPQQVQINTQNGELLVHITLDLNLNLTGAIADSVKSGKKQVVDDQEAEKVEWQVPEFSSAKVKFGKEQNDAR